MAFPLTSPSIGKMIRFIDRAYTSAQIGTLLLECGADAWAPATWANKQQRLQDAFSSLRADGDPEASRVALRVAEAVLVKGAPPIGGGGAADWWDELRATIEADGWEYDASNRRLTAVIPGVSVAEVSTSLEEQLRRQGWSTAADHYRQALDNFGKLNWASCNSQLRCLVEEILPTAALAVSGVRPKDVQGSLDALKKAAVLVEGEYGMVKGLWSMCQPRGSHPGLSDREEAVFRLLAVTAHCRFLMSRLPG
jgi:hypothetical protein